MKPRHIIAVVAIGTSLIFVAPTSERAGQAEKVESAGDAAQDVKIVPAYEETLDLVSGQAKLQPASFNGDAENLKD